jgi:hypothetical protein
MGTIEIIILITTLLAFAGVGIFLLIRYLKSRKEEEAKYDFTTKYGTKVMLSPELKMLTPEIIESWTDSVVSFWHGKRGWDKEKSYKMIGRAKVEMYDELYLERAGIKVNGILWPSSFLIEMATLPKGTNSTPLKKVASLFRHETSHIVCEYVGGVKSGKNFGEIHHELFAEVGLGA